MIQYTNYGSEHKAIEAKPVEQPKPTRQPSGKSRDDDLAELRRRLMKGKDENT